jgi:hypothetical protein
MLSPLYDLYKDFASVLKFSKLIDYMKYQKGLKVKDGVLGGPLIKWLDVVFTKSNPYMGQALGKLSLKNEAAGKVRVFAMVDPVTQWLLAPLHKLIFKILRKIPMDGTFNQLGPINRLLKMENRQGLYSLDLSAATDRLPVSLQARLLDHLFKDIPYFGQK